MGYRANTITQHRRYGGEPFADWDEFVHEFIPAMRDQGVDISGNEEDSYHEVDKQALQDFVNRTPVNDEQSLYPSYTNAELVRALQESIDETPDTYIAWEWL